MREAKRIQFRTGAIEEDEDDLANVMGEEGSDPGHCLVFQDKVRLGPFSSLISH